MVSLQVRDATCELYVKVNMFGYSEKDLPCVTAIGDIIYLIGAKKQDYVTESAYSALVRYTIVFNVSAYSYWAIFAGPS